MRVLGIFVFVWDLPLCICLAMGVSLAHLTLKWCSLALRLRRAQRCRDSGDLAAVALQLANWKASRMGRQCVLIGTGTGTPFTTIVSVN